MFHACVRKFDVMVTVVNFLGSERGLSAAKAMVVTLAYQPIASKQITL